MLTRTLWLSGLLVGAALPGCGASLVADPNQDPTPVVAGIAESRPLTTESTPATPATESSAAPVETPKTLSGKLYNRGEYQIFALGAGQAGQRWTISEAGQWLYGPTFVVALFDENNELLRRELVTSAAPLEHVLRADAAALYLGVTPALGTGGGDFQFDVNSDNPDAVPATVPQTVWLNFGGGGNVSVHGRAAISFGAFDAAGLGSAYAVQTAAIKAAIVETMREDYADFDVAITTSDEGSTPDGPHATIQFGGRDDRLLGLADNVDQYNEDPWQTAVIYVDGFADFAVMDLSAEEMGQMIGNVASHECGHLLGLFHTQVPTDLMDTTGTAWDLAGAQAFSRATLEASVFPFGYENGPQRLAETVGLKPAEEKPLAKPLQAARIARKAALRALARNALYGRCGTCLHLDE